MTPNVFDPIGVQLTDNNQMKYEFKHFLQLFYSCKLFSIQHYSRLWFVFVFWLGPKRAAQFS